MNCRNATNVIRSILTETATAQETTAFQEHLMDCPRCFRLYNGLPETAALLDRLASSEVSADFDKRFARRLRDAKTSSTRTGHTWIRAVAVIGHSDCLWASAAVVAVIFFALIQAYFPKEAEEPLSISRINVLAMIIIIMMSSTIIRKVLESDFRLSDVFGRTMR